MWRRQRLPGIRVLKRTDALKTAAAAGADERASSGCIPPIRGTPVERRFRGGGGACMRRHVKGLFFAVQDGNVLRFDPRRTATASICSGIPGPLVRGDGSHHHSARPIMYRINVIGS